MTHPVQRAIDVLMAVCDGAHSRDNAGFSKADVNMVKYDGAPPEVLDDAEIAGRLIKYHRQLGEDLTKQLQDIKAAGKEGIDDPGALGVIFVEEGYLKLIIPHKINAGKASMALRSLGFRRLRNDEGRFEYIEPKERILHLKAEGFRVAPRTLKWCAQNYGRPNEYDLF